MSASGTLGTVMLQWPGEAVGNTPCISAGQGGPPSRRVASRAYVSRVRQYGGSQMVQRCRRGDADLAAVAVSEVGDGPAIRENSWPCLGLGTGERHGLGSLEIMFVCCSWRRRADMCLVATALGLPPARRLNPHVPRALHFWWTERETRQLRTTL